MGKHPREIPNVDTECASCHELLEKVDDMISEMARSHGICLELERELAVKEDTITELYHYGQASQGDSKCGYRMCKLSWAPRQ